MCAACLSDDADFEVMSKEEIAALTPESTFYRADPHRGWIECTVTAVDDSGPERRICWRSSGRSFPSGREAPAFHCSSMAGAAEKIFHKKHADPKPVA